MMMVSRRLVRAALVASTALALGAPAMAAPGKDGGMCHPGLSRLTVSGQGEARVAPDMATIQMGVTTQAASAAEAMRQNSTQQTAVIEALTGAGVETADIQTSGLNLTPMMDYGEGRAPAVTGYQASNMVAVRIKDVARLGEVLDAIVGAGANEINGIGFTRDDATGTEDEARRAAVADARHKAEVLAEAAGLTLGPVLVLRDTPSPEGPRPMMMEARAMAADAKVPVAAGEVAMNATVEMQFALSGADCGPVGDRPPHRHGLPEGHPPVPGEDAGAPVPGDLPPPMGTDTGAPAPGEPVVPMGTSPAEPPAN